MNTQFSIPDPGCQIAVTFEFPSYVIGCSKVSKTTITGVVEKATKFTPPDFIRIVTDFDSPVRTREIPVSRITNIEYSDGRTADTHTVDSDTRSWTVEGSRGGVQYIVATTNNTWSCTCPGFQFRRTCKHVVQLKGN
jgi:hypothetical protein